MAKPVEKEAVKSPRQANSVARSASKNGAAGAVDKIEKASKEALEKLKALNLDPQLQADIEWCLGSYNHDKNPVGLYEMIKRALMIFREAKSKNPKVISTKLISDLEKILADH